MVSYSDNRGHVAPIASVSWMDNFFLNLLRTVNISIIKVLNLLSDIWNTFLNLFSNIRFYSFLSLLMPARLVPVAVALLVSSAFTSSVSHASSSGIDKTLDSFHYWMNKISEILLLWCLLLRRFFLGLLLLLLLVLLICDLTNKILSLTDYWIQKSLEINNIWVLLSLHILILLLLLGALTRKCSH